MRPSEYLRRMAPTQSHEDRHAFLVAAALLENVIVQSSSDESSVVWADITCKSSVSRIGRHGHFVRVKFR
jgi:hypothetical protein